MPVQCDASAHILVIKPHGFFTQVGVPDGFTLTLNDLGLAASRVNFNASHIGCMPETQDVVNYCRDNKMLPQIQINARHVNDAWEKVVNKEARYCFVIDTATF